jgi:polyhydroxybutyrate depolymerase
VISIAGCSKDETNCGEGMVYNGNSCDIEEPVVECEVEEVYVGEKCIYDMKNYTNTTELLTHFHDDVGRKYLLYIPEGYDFENMPLVVVLHGYTGTAFGIRNYSKMDQLALREGFAVVYPQGLRLRGSTHFNVGLDSSDVDDIGFISSLIDYLQDKYGLSEEDTFITGMSNGGYMSYTMVIEKPDYFKAMASVGGVISYHPWHIEEYQEMNILQIHGTSDLVVPIDGSWPYDDAWGDVPGLDVLLERWKTVNKTNMELIEQYTESTVSYKYWNEESNKHVWYYEIEGYGHDWPIRRQYSNRVDPGFNASELIWEFFSQFVETE